MSTLALQRRLSDIVAEYDTKVAAIPDTVAIFEAAGNALKTAATVGSTWGNTRLDVGGVYEHAVRDSLLKSAWRYVYDGLNIKVIASAADKRRFEQAMEKPAPFTLDNIAGTFGKFVQNPRGNILRGLAEVFCDLDPAYKSHDKVKIGVAGLPKRIILSNVGGFSSWGKDRLESCLNALAAFQNKPLVTWREIDALLAEENALLCDGELPANRTWDKPERIVGRGVRLRRFANGNGHLFFEPETLRDINRALAEYYGDVLADCAEARPAKPRSGTAVAADLQYYPTPQKVVESIVADLYGLKGARVLEPSCGCGRFMDALRKAGASVLGVEVDPGRAAMVRAKGHNVMRTNFLETVPTGDFDHVVMNPPFYGRHYAKHIEHARKFLKPGGTLTAVLPATARYDHGLVDGRWADLPVGSFSESGTNINTSLLTIRVSEGTVGAP